MATDPREWPNNFGALRNNMAELLRENFESLMAIQISKLTAEEEQKIEDVMHNDMMMLRALERAGAKTDPLTEVQNRVMKMTTKLGFLSARS